MGGTENDRQTAQSIELENQNGAQPEAQSKFYVDAYLNSSSTAGGGTEVVRRTGDKDAQAPSDNATTDDGVLGWIEDHPGTSTVIGLAALAGIGYLTRGKWMPALSRLGPFADDATRVAAARTGTFDAAKAGLTAFSEVSHPELQAWKTALGYSDVGLDATGSLIYRGAKAGTFAENVLVVNGSSEANTLFRALSREGLLERKVWERGAGSAATQLGEVKLAGPTKFIFSEGKTIQLPANGRLIDLGNNEFNALSSEAAEKLYSGLTMF